MIKSQSILHSDFHTEWYKKWSKQLKQYGKYLESYKPYANKFWQNAIMCEVLEQKGKLVAGNSAIGFGVGQERLPALFAKKGVQVTATDQDSSTQKAKHWAKYELATGKHSLNQLGICDKKSFSKNVTYKAVDMNSIPRSLHNSFDFLWSNCALGHLGSVANGLKFIEESAKCLNTGGVATHTTEINVISNYDTLDNNPETVIFRPKDMYKLVLKLLNEGFIMDPPRLIYSPETQDQDICFRPEFGNEYTKLQVGGHVLTQLVIIISRPEKISILQKIIHKISNYYTYKKNILFQNKFKNQNKLLKQIKEYERSELQEGSIVPYKNKFSINLKDRPVTIYVKYRNNTDYPIFGMHNRLKTTKPIALATYEPAERKSIFTASDWYGINNNRASIYLVEKTGRDWKELDYVRPKGTFSYRLTLDPAKFKKGECLETFCVVQEGNKYIKSSKIDINIKKTKLY